MLPAILIVLSLLTLLVLVDEAVEVTPAARRVKEHRKIRRLTPRPPARSVSDDPFATGIAQE